MYLKKNQTYCKKKQIGHLHLCINLKRNSSDTNIYTSTSKETVRTPTSILYSVHKKKNIGHLHLYCTVSIKRNRSDTYCTSILYSTSTLKETVRTPTSFHLSKNKQFGHQHLSIYLSRNSSGTFYHLPKRIKPDIFPSS